MRGRVEGVKEGLNIQESFWTLFTNVTFAINGKSEQERHARGKRKAWQESRCVGDPITMRVRESTGYV